MALKGPRLEPKHAKPTHLVVLCHGYGSDGNDLIGLAPPLRQYLPTAAFVAPDGPQPCPGAARQWFAISELDPVAMHKGVTAAAPELESFVKAELSRLSLTPDKLALVGFSQGTMMALHVGLSGMRPAAVVGFSGMLTGAPQGEELPPVLLLHGARDPLIPIDALFLSAAMLGAAGARVQWHVAPGLEHGIDDSEIALAGAFLALAVAGQLAAIGPSCCEVR